GISMPEFIDYVTETERIARWASTTRRAGKPGCIKAVPNDAVRIARVAYDKGLSLEGTKFFLGGEPFTEAKREVIERVGATATSQYGFLLGGIVGYGCAQARVLDEVHVNQHLWAVVRHPRSIAANGPAVEPLLFSALHPSSPLMFLNTENG